MSKVSFSFVVLLFFAINSFMTSCGSMPQNSGDKEGLTQYVDPFIGTDSHGHVFLGANVPFGGVQVGPSNEYKGWDWSSSYHYSDSIVKGFTHLNLSGTGCADLGELLIMPATGELRMHNGSRDPIADKGYASYYRKNTEVAKPGYYKVDLESYGIKAEITATERVGYHRYTYPKAKQARLIIDLGQGNCDLPVETYLHQINETTYEGYRSSKGWAGTQIEYVHIVLSKPAKQFILQNANDRIDDVEGKGVYMKCALEFETTENEVVEVKVAVSPVSMKNAALNMEAEVPGWNFDEVYATADAKWNKELSKVTIKTDDISKKRVFYTAMYHTMIAPNLFSDVNGQYRGTDQKVYDNPGFTNYTLFSLWDTYRAAHPLFTITQPERVSDMINSMLLIFKQQGKLPVWHLRGFETNTMPGYSAIPVVVDACLKGYEGIDVEAAYEAIKETATGDHEPGVKDLMKYGYIPADFGPESVASNMEYAISDWAISKLADKLGKTEDAAYFANRAKAYQQYFDSETRFMRGKMEDGSWRTPFNPFSAEHRVNDYCEGNAWQYLWMVPQDPEGLIDLLGGDALFTQKLDSLFEVNDDMGEHASIDITGLVGMYAHGNEPSHHTAYMYAYAGEQHKTADLVRHIMTELYTDKPDGLCGNEDCGQMSAWYVFSSMGFYPVNPANGMYVFGSPLFDETCVSNPNGTEFKVIAENNSAENIFIQSVELNGTPYNKSYITHKEIINGGVLRFVMGPKPNTEFGFNKDDRPQSIVY
ncbi:GH92 family glycosyl hydrolase [Carboxylicivirga marina]|uniref:GH92 family glycosyl hydrolase n=1 Tax=Carboxylicivirga marina TaxID=2800988 RepID=A0ABS1HN96_9BACT|nr:GH92 family glycosyl hydrolase [Carboxylicivirga marina]MBK3519160.1 GH92 family glycosyl hydrolase [Carboxylicivirga marina]